MQLKKIFSINVYFKNNLLKYTYLAEGSQSANFMKTPLYCLPPTAFFKFFQPHPPPPLALCVALFFFWKNGGSHHIWCVMFYFNTLWIYACRALILQYHKDLVMCFTEQGINFTELKHITWFFATTLIWYHMSQTGKRGHTAHAECNRLTHPRKFI